MQWEYKEVSFNDLGKETNGLSLEPGLNKLGIDGWELVAVNGDSKDRYHSHFIFKRVVRSPS
jgi:hypothetical protein